MAEEQSPWCTLGGGTRCGSQGATSQSIISISVHAWSVCRNQCITRSEDQDVECLGQTGTTLQLWDLGSTTPMTEKLCAFYRQYLRILASYHWPTRHISNNSYKALYRPLSIDVQQFRLCLFGHCLRMHTNTPASLGKNASAAAKVKQHT